MDRHTERCGSCKLRRGHRRPPIHRSSFEHLRAPETNAAVQGAADYLARMCLFKVNAGLREQEVCRLRWEWEIRVPELDTSVFVIPGFAHKNGEDRLVVLNRIAKSVVEEQRGKHRQWVFAYDGRPFHRLYCTAWKNGRVRAAPSAR
jgi:integrase